MTKKIDTNFDYNEEIKTIETDIVARIYEVP